MIVSYMRFYVFCNAVAFNYCMLISPNP